MGCCTTEPSASATAAEEPDDAALVARCRTGDATAWAALVQRYQRLVYAIVRRLGDDEQQAADVFQAVFTRLLQHLPRLEQPERLRAWIVTTARREAWRLRRQQRRFVPLPDEEGPALDEPASPWAGGADPASDPGPEDQWQALQELHQVREAVARLSPACQRLIALLFDGDDAPSYQEAARQLGMPVGSLGPNRGRCLARLRALLAEGS
jgi:RNA polymerase sigma factor (sigma-70 family)